MSKKINVTKVHPLNYGVFYRATGDYRMEYKVVNLTFTKTERRGTLNLVNFAYKL
jgi:hypothetical protein